MAILWCDSFNSYGTTSDLSKGWGSNNSPSGQITVSLTGGPSSDPCATFVGAAFTVYDLATTLYGTPTGTVLGGRFKMKQSSAATTSNLPFMTIACRSSAPVTTTIYLGVTVTSGVVYVTQGNASSSTAIASGTTNLADGAWHLVEFQIDLKDASGTAKVWIDGVLEVNFTGDMFSGTAHATAPWLTALTFSSCAGATITRALKDVIIFDDATTNAMRTSSQPYGNVTIATLRPNGAGTTTQFTPNTGLNYAAVDEVAEDDGTTYVEATTSGFRDLYTMSDMGVVPSAVLGVVAKVFASNPGSGTISMKQTLKSGGTTDVGASAVCNIIGSYKSKPYDLNPNGSIAWTLVAVDALEQGFEVA